MSSRLPLPYEEALATNSPAPNMILTLPSFSVLLRSSETMISSMVFTSGHYIWRFHVCPSGPPHGQVSFGVSLEGTESHCPLPVSAEVDVKFNVYLLNYNTKEFVKVGENPSQKVHFKSGNLSASACRTMPLLYLTNLHNGFLYRDECTFGVEVFVCGSTCVRECFTLPDTISPVKYRFEVKPFTTRFTALQKEYSGCSPDFTFGNYHCCILYYAPEDKGGTLRNGFVKSITRPPSSSKDITETEKRFLSLYLDVKPECLEEEGKWVKQIKVKVVLCVRDQSSSEEHVRKEGTLWLACDELLGWPKFMELGVLTDPSKGFMLDDTVIIDAEITLLATLNRSFPE